MRSGRQTAVAVALVFVSALAHAQDEEALAVPEVTGDAEYVEASPPNAEEGTLVYNFGQRPLQNVADGTIRVSVENAIPSAPTGYTPLRVFVSNIGNKPQPVSLQFDSRAATNATVRRELEVPPGSNVTVTLLIPSGAQYGQLTAASPGIKTGGRQPLHFTGATATILALGTDEQFQATAKRAPDHGTYTTLVQTFPVLEAPTELAAYIGFAEVVALTPLDQVPEPARRALEAYAAAGGTLVLTQPARDVAAWFPMLKSTEAGLHPYGFGRVRLCGRDRAQCARALQDDLFAAVPLVKPLPASAHATNTYAYGAAAAGVPEAERFLLPQATAPIGRFLLIILMFTLAIGPGSVWVARRKGPPMLLLTIPATAALTCLLIVGYSVLVDGFSIHAATRGYTLLDAKNNRAITAGVSAFYANVSPGDATFDSTSVLLGPVPPFAAEQVPSVDWTHGAKFDSDFIPSRTYREWGMVSVTPTRARLVVRPTAGGVEIQNALGSDIAHALVRSGGTLYSVRELPEGGSARGEPLPHESNVEQGLNAFASRFDAQMVRAATAAPADGEFVARVQGPAFLQLGGLQLTHHPSDHYVRGEVSR